jgi:hypothetical protein
MTKIHKVIYLVFGSFAILFGLATLLVPAWLVSEAHQSFHLIHNLREQGAAIVFLGSMSLWCFFNYDRNRVVHYLLTLFTLLLSGIHWFDFSQGHLPLISPLYNTVPFLVFAVMALTRKS